MNEIDQSTIKLAQAFVRAAKLKLWPTEASILTLCRDGAQIGTLASICGVSKHNMTMRINNLRRKRLVRNTKPPKFVGCYVPTERGETIIHYLLTGKKIDMSKFVLQPGETPREPKQGTVADPDVKVVAQAVLDDAKHLLSGVEIANCEAVLAGDTYDGAMMTSLGIEFSRTIAQWRDHDNGDDRQYV